MSGRQISLIKYRNAEDLKLNTKDLHIFCQIIPDHILRDSKRYKLCLLNTEQLSIKTWQGKKMPEYVSKVLKSGIPVIDYDLYQSQMFDSDIHHYLPYQLYTEELDRLTKLVNGTRKTYDVAFCCVGNSTRRKTVNDALVKKGLKVIDVRGWKSTRDSKIAKAKVLINVHYRDDYQVFEHMRCDRWALTGQLIVSESGSSDASLDIKDLLIVTNLNDMVDRVYNVVRNYRKYSTEQQQKIKTSKADIIRNRAQILTDVMNILRKDRPHESAAVSEEDMIKIVTRRNADSEDAVEPEPICNDTDEIPEIHRIEVVNCKTDHLNGIYTIDESREYQSTIYSKDHTHQIYRYAGEWRIGHLGKQLYLKLGSEYSGYSLKGNVIDFKGSETRSTLSYRSQINIVNPIDGSAKSGIITFIIPSIGRSTLIRTVRSLSNQIDSQWSAIICYDGVQPSQNILDIVNRDSRITYIVLPKKGFKNCAGEVRNDGISKVTTEWIGFVDDDDLLTPDYVCNFKKEIQTTPDAECVVFRMSNNRKVIIPGQRTTDITEVGDVGISYAVKTQLFKSGLKFTSSGTEDYDLFMKIKNNKHRIVISDKINYLVRGTITSRRLAEVAYKSRRCVRAIIN
jgi:Glycosyl transferase family 2